MRLLSAIALALSCCALVLWGITYFRVREATRTLDDILTKFEQMIAESQQVVTAYLENDRNYAFIPSGSYTTFMLKSQAVAVIDQLTFRLADNSARNLISQKRDQIMDGLMSFFLSIDKSAFASADETKKVKTQIRSLVNEILGFPVVEDVYLYIKAISEVE